MKIDVINGVLGKKIDKQVNANVDNDNSAISASGFDKISNKYLLAGAAVVILMLALAIIYAANARKVSIKQGLTAEEKNRLLVQLKELLAHE